jgi:PKHD-type hydroxylase
MKQNNNWQWYMSKPNFLTSEECDELVEKIKSTEKGEQGCLDDHIGDDHNTDFRNVTEWYLHKDMRDYVVGDYSSLQQKLFVAGKVCNQLSWNFNVQEVENNIKMIEYLPGDFFTWHSDFNNGKSSTRKLAMIIQLSDPKDYEGGSTQLAIQDPKTLEFYEMPKEKGTLLVFCPLLFHRVTPVESGVRYCIQEFMLGDTFV